MPVGMCLRSNWGASHIADPNSELTLDEYCRQNGKSISKPIPLDNFVDYGRWYQRHAVPDLDQRQVRTIEIHPRGFKVCLSDGEEFTSRRVVVAAGISPFAVRPAEFAAIPSTLASHTSEHNDLSKFSGQRIVVIGAGQSALESAALLREAGIPVEVIARARALNWVGLSSAHRVAPGWVYGFPEMCEGQGERIRSARKVANPGCHATGAIAILRPLTQTGLLPRDFAVSIGSISGYSGGGKSMIEAYESGRAPAFEHYALGFEHKHMPEISQYSGLSRRPIFMPSVANFRQGILVSVPLALDALPARPTGADLRAALKTHYGENRYVRVAPPQAAGRLEPESLNGTNELELHVFVNEPQRQAVVIAKFDNLGKGASGAAVQNLELMLGL